jgi:DNA-binding NarL/FixJ family response regulator
MPVLVVSSHPEEQYALRVIRAGAAGYISKASASAELLKAVKAVINGGRYVSPSLAEALSADLHRRDPQAIHETLSDREFQVMSLIGSGKTVGEIAALLGISDKTVSTYRARVLDKTGMKNNAELVRYVVEQRLAD